MLTREENDRLTQVGPGTPMGALMRRYWQPIGARSEMDERWTKRVRLLGEDLVLFKNRSGGFGLVGESCPHRRASLFYGIPEADGLRCPYHGWKFDGAGACIDQPNEPEGSNFKDKVSTAGYPVQELGGMLWAYLGPAPAPLIPRLDGFVAENTIRICGHAVLPCNWLQIMENSVDSIHAEWVHGKLYEFLMEKDGVKVAIGKHHAKTAYEEVELGINKRRLLVGQSEDVDDWKIGHPMIFPNTLGLGNKGPRWYEYRFQIRVPMDDTHTQHYWYHAYVPPADMTAPAELLEKVHVYDVPYLDERGEYILDSVHGQDIMAWISQGEIADRTQEALSSTDRGVTLYRKILMRELKNVEEGRDPKMTFRDPAQNQTINVPVERQKAHRGEGFANMFSRHEARYSPMADQIVAFFDQPDPVLTPA